MRELCARDVMTTEVTTVSQDVLVEELIGLLRASHFSGIPVVDGDGRAVGVVSETDILRALAYTIGPPGSGEFAPTFQAGKKRVSSVLLDAVSHDDLHAAASLRGLVSRPVRELMTPYVHHCGPDARVVEVCEMLVWKEIRRVVVLDAERRPIGMISSIDLIRRLGEWLHHADEAHRA
ncbi:MAG: CBS domain-containing protein [Planctomycetes bacterium]|nr:CBS domain-containing protein [Planctomycetota bacterium]